jgi:hypothetical protein
MMPSCLNTSEPYLKKQRIIAAGCDLYLACEQNLIVLRKTMRWA